MIIFDLDLTLVDTGPVESLRKGGKWGAVMGQISKLKVYDGITELLNELHARRRSIAIVTKSPDMIANAFIKRHKWPIDNVVGFHHVKRRKPDPEGLLLAMSRVGATAENTIHVGDRPEDTQAARAAHVKAIGAGWGLTDTEPLEASEPDHLFMTVLELKNFLLEG